MRDIIKHILKEELRFNDGRLNKNGSNTIYDDDNPIVDFGIGEIGVVEVGDEVYPNSIFLKGGFNASEQGKGYGSKALEFIFNKLPKIQNIIVQCYDTACPFWLKKGGVKVLSKDINKNNKPLHTVVINRNDFKL